HACWLIMFARVKLLARFRNYSADRFLAYRLAIPWRKIFRAVKAATACFVVLICSGAFWRHRINTRGQAAWQRARAAHPEFLREPEALPPAPKINPAENLAEAPLFQQLQPRGRR